MFRKTIITATPLFGAVAISAAKPDESKETKTSEVKPIICKPSELPIYRADEPVKSHKHSDSKMYTTIEGGVRVVRSETQNVLNSMTAQKKQVTDMIDKGKQETKCKFWVVLFYYITLGGQLFCDEF